MAGTLTWELYSLGDGVEVGQAGQRQNEESLDSKDFLCGSKCLRYFPKRSCRHKCKYTTTGIWPVEMSVKMLMSYIGVPEFNSQLLLLAPASCSCGFWQAVVMIQVVEFLPPIWKTWIEFLESGFTPTRY